MARGIKVESPKPDDPIFKQGPQFFKPIPRPPEACPEKKAPQPKVQPNPPKPDSKG